MTDTPDTLNEPETPNEIVAAARDARRGADAAPAEQRRNWPRTAVTVGIGSAAVAAALIYANRSRGG